MLSKLLFRDQDRLQLILAIIGSFMGITFLVCSIHYIIKVNEFGKGADILGPNTIILQKKVTNSSSLNLTKTDFSIPEINKIKRESFVIDVKPVISNNFNISFETSDPLVPYFRTDVFVQTLDQNFLDVHTDKWHWKKGDKYLPMIMPREFLVMLNTFMSASGIPQISEDLVKQVKFKFKLWNDSIQEHVNVKIIGFTNEVSSILVPESFMKYGNEIYSDGKNQKITQIMISGKENEFGLVEDLINKKGLESKNSQLLVGRLKSVVGTLFLVVLGISLIAVLTSGLVLIQYMQLLISRNAYEVRTLLRIGYAPNVIIKSFFYYFIKIFGLITILSLLVFIIIKYFIDNMFLSGGLYIDTKITFLSILSVLITYLLFIYSSYKSAKKGINSNSK